MLSGVILDLDTLYPEDLDLSPLLDNPQVEWSVHGRSKPEEIVARIRDADLVLTNKAPVMAEQLAAATGLRYIGVLATGTNVIDMAEAKRREIVVTRIVNYGTPAIVQHVFALILALTTKLPVYAAAVNDGGWSASEDFCLLGFPVRELDGLTMGIIGYGTLGQAVAAVARAFGMRVVVAQLPGWQPQAKDVERELFADFLRMSDIVTIHCPLQDNTRRLISAPEFALMRDDALLINCARGEIVDSQALARALKEGVIGGAGLDVLDQEPPPADHVLLDCTVPNLITTPHCAWGAREARQRLVEIAAINLQNWLHQA